jgi:maltokinase
MNEAIDPRLGAALAGWLPTRRWFADKGRRIEQVRVHRIAELVAPGARGLVATATVTFRTAPDRCYQVLLGFRRGESRVPEGERVGILDGVAVYDATDDPALMVALLRAVADGRLGGPPSPEVRAALAGADLPARRPAVEQSNTSIVFGDRFVLKLFRSPGMGTNPELEVQRALSGHPHVARLVAAIEVDGPVTLGVIQEFVPDATDGWRLATAALANPEPAGLGGRLYALGATVAHVHAGLAAAFGTRPLTPELAHAARAGMINRLEAVIGEVPALGAHRAALRRVFDDVARCTGDAFQRVHGDLHLGQALWSGGRWLLIDFEGEPGLPIEERRALRSPLRDVAGMLRSIEYAAAEVGGPSARRWADGARAAFLSGYRAVSANNPGPLCAYELDKALYELAYETRNRPERVGTPWRAVRAFASAAGRGR